ncbi:MAG TPA: Crp/Fnr family transcriptional regulator [Thermoleophilaceae bacterium]|jgi:CRP-like cAMP-binding protein
MTSISDTQVRVLDADPDLAAGLPADELPAATHAALARTYLLATGTWTPPASWAGSASTLGLLVLDGLVMRSLELGDRSSTELLGEGDLLRPWQRDTEEALVACSVQWRVLEPTRIAVLDGRFALAIARWPRLTAAVVGRALRRSRAHGVFAAISHVNRVDDRLVLAFWYFAERWGRVGPDGVAVRLPLTHEQLGAMIGARRPSVTTALSSLAAQGILVPRRRGEWVLTPTARLRIDGLPEAARGGAQHAPRLAA